MSHSEWDVKQMAEREKRIAEGRCPCCNRPLEGVKLGPADLLSAHAIH